MKKIFDEYADNPEAQKLIRLILYTTESVFLTGKAGTGKSTLLKKIIPCLKKNYILLAPTGIAALNIEGQTIHSFFRFEPRAYLPDDRDIENISEDLLKSLDLIIIDEVSMVRSDILNAIDISLRKNLNSNKPFAGKQLLLIGDLYQLPPILDKRKSEEIEILNTYSTRHFFGAKSFEAGFIYHIIELEKVYRQNDASFIELLNGIRKNNITNEHLTSLNQKYSLNNNNEHIMTLATRNIIVDSINQKELEKLSTPVYKFQSIATGNFESSDIDLPTERILTLKQGTQVMFVKNDSDKRWVNGSIGRIVEINANQIKITLDSNNSTFIVPQVTWESYKYIWNKKEQKIEKLTNGTFTQYPIKLAWAITIHKSQGQTFNKIAINLGTGAFEAGQTYVALSRCKSLDGITLQSRINKKDIIVDDEIITYFKNKKNLQFEGSIINGMQNYIYNLEDINNKIINEVRQLQSDIKITQLKNNEKEGTIYSLTSDNKYLTEKLILSENKNSTKNVIIVILILICIFMGLKTIMAL